MPYISLCYRHWCIWLPLPLCDWLPSSKAHEVGGQVHGSPHLCPQHLVWASWAKWWRKAHVIWWQQTLVKDSNTSIFGKYIKLIPCCFSASEPAPREPAPSFVIQKTQIDEREEFGPRLPPVFCPSESRAPWFICLHWHQSVPWHVTALTVLYPPI